MINRIRQSMRGYGFYLTHEQVKTYIDQNPITHNFDTVERENYAQWLGREITGMCHPKYGDSKNYKKEFYVRLEVCASIKGYKVKLSQ